MDYSPLKRLASTGTEVGDEKDKRRLSNFSLVHTTPEKFENRVTLRTHQMFSVHTTPETFVNATFTGNVRFVF